jgi:putative aldouronate transport system permease protein
MKKQQIVRVAPPKKKSTIAEFTQIKPVTNVIFNILLAAFAISCLIPVLLVIAISFSEEYAITQHGYKFIPEVFTLEAYRFMFMQGSQILHALEMSVLVTAMGTGLSIMLTTSLGYVLSRRDFKLHSFYTWIVFIPMIISGGLVSSYFINTQMLRMGNTIWVLFIPGAVSSFNVIICRTFFRTNVPDAIIESALMDGASQMTVFFRLIMPLSLPVVATIGLFMSFGLWNDWFTSMLYIDDMNLFTLQALLNKMLTDIEQLVKSMDTVGVSSMEMLLKLPKEGARMAIVVIVVVPIACVYPFFQRYFISGLTIGAVKE